MTAINLITIIFSVISVLTRFCGRVLHLSWPSPKSHPLTPITTTTLPPQLLTQQPHPLAIHALSSNAGRARFVTLMEDVEMAIGRQAGRREPPPFVLRK